MADANADPCGPFFLAETSVALEADAEFFDNRIFHERGFLQWKNY